MELTRETVENAATEYESAQPLCAVEEEHLEMLPETFASGEYGWRDAEWVVQWYFRRFLGAVPNRDRRAVEDAYGENDYEDVHDAIAAAVEAAAAATGGDSGATAEKLDALTDLSGVDVPVASGFLCFLEPDRYLPVGEREWRVLEAAGELSAPYPDPPTVEDYLRYDSVCRAVCDRLDVDPWTLYRALWLLGAE